MQLVGASPVTVYSPFLIEGAVQGALGGALAGVLAAERVHRARRIRPESGEPRDTPRVPRRGLLRGWRSRVGFTAALLVARVRRVARSDALSTKWGGAARSKPKRYARFRGTMRRRGRRAGATRRSGGGRRGAGRRSRATASRTRRVRCFGGGLDVAALVDDGTGSLDRGRPRLGPGASRARRRVVLLDMPQDAGAALPELAAGGRARRGRERLEDLVCGTGRPSRARSRRGAPSGSPGRL